MIGKTTAFNNEKLFRGFPWRREETTERMNLTPFIEAAKSLAGKNTGALIVFAKTSELQFYSDSGDFLDAAISKRLLLSIFNKTSPLARWCCNCGWQPHKSCPLYFACYRKRRCSGFFGFASPRGHWLKRSNRQRDSGCFGRDRAN